MEMPLMVMVLILKPLPVLFVELSSGPNHLLIENRLTQARSAIKVASSYRERSLLLDRKFDCASVSVVNLPSRDTELMSRNSNATQLERSRTRSDDRLARYNEAQCISLLADLL